MSVTGYAFSDCATTTKPKYSGKSDVLRNRGSFGRRQRVFIHYVPTSQYTCGEYMGELEKRIYDFSLHLITYGFDVRVDLLCDRSTRFDRSAWSDHELSQADWVIFVCSRSSYELFNFSFSSDASYIDQETRNNISLLRRTLYNRLSNDATNKVIPVILLPEDNETSYVPPTLRDLSNILRIFEDTPFDYDNQGGHFERLLCRMAGINRSEINSSGIKEGFVELLSKIPKRKLSVFYSIFCTLWLTIIM